MNASAKHRPRAARRLSAVTGALTLCLGVGCIDLRTPSMTGSDAAAAPDSGKDSSHQQDAALGTGDDSAPDITAPPTDVREDSPGTPVSSGPIAHWPLDESRGTRFEDQTPNTGSGWALNGATWITAELAETLGGGNRAALRFDGTNDYGILGVAGLPENGAAFTVSLWLNATATTLPQDLFNLTDGIDRGVELGIRAGNLVVLDGDNLTLASSPAPPAGQWHHVVYSYDEGRSRLFVAGQLKVAVKTPSPLGAVHEAWLASFRGRSAFFAGSLDDVRVYNRALSDAEVAEIAGGAPAEPTAARDGGPASEIDASGPVPPAIPDLIAYWKLDEAVAGARANDASGNGNNAAPANAPIPAAPAPGFAFANPHSLSFNVGGGIPNQCALITNTARFNISGVITMSAWIKPTLSAGAQQVIAHGSGAAETGLRLDNNNYVVYSRNATMHAASFPIPREDVSEWVHLVGTHDGAAWRLYRNGRQVAVAPDEIGALASNGYWGLGSGSNCDSWFFQGSLDDVRVFRRALRPGEIRQINAGFEY